MFTKEQCSIIAEFYAKHRLVLDNVSRKPESTAKVNGLYRILTDELNSSSSTTQWSMGQVREKVQSLKKAAKKKTAANRRAVRVTGGGSEDEIQLTDAESLIASQFVGTPSYQGIPGGGFESGRVKSFEKDSVSDNGSASHSSSDPPIASSSSMSERMVSNLQASSEIAQFVISESLLERADSRDDDQSSFMQNPDDEAEDNRRRMVHNSDTWPIDNENAIQHQSDPNQDHTPKHVNIPSKTPKRRRRRTNFKEAIRAGQLELIKLQSEAAAFQVEVMKQQKELNGELSLSLKEFRSAIFEYRLSMRGANVANISLNQPEGIDINV